MYIYKYTFYILLITKNREYNAINRLSTVDKAHKWH